MATEILACDAVSTPNDWQLVTGTDKVSAVALPHDGDSSVVRPNNADVSQQWSLANPVDIQAGDTINKVTIKSRGRWQSSSTTKVKFAIVIGSDVVYGADHTSATNTVYEDFADDFTTTPTGGAWTLTDLQNLEVRGTNATPPLNRFNVTTLYVEVDYTPASSYTERGGMFFPLANG